MKISSHGNTPDTSRSVHLSASAGSGKTRALTERYLGLLHLLEKDTLGLDQAVAITFTDKAAAEIKKRVMELLPETMLKNIVRGGQDLRISTIHSFCMNLLKRYPLEAGLPPDFGILDDRDRAFLVRRAVEEALEELDREPDAAALWRLTADELTTVAGSLLAMRSRLKHIEIDAGGPEAMFRNLEAGLAVSRTESELQALIAGGGLGTVLREMEAHLRTQAAHYDRCLGPLHVGLAAAADPAAALPLAAALGPAYFNKDGSPKKVPLITKKDFTGNGRAAYEASFFHVQDLLVLLRDLPARIEAAREALGLLRLFQLADSRYRDLKLREGMLDFDDLEIAAYRLLRGLESPDILYWLDRKVLHYLVDEFQDTSDIQWAVLKTLTAEIFAGEGAEKPQQPTLFVVGDRKQSIYRFREANYRLIDDVKKLIEGLPAGERKIDTLDRNYRSTPEVVAAVNRVFTDLWPGGYEPAVSDRAGHHGSVRLVEIASARSAAAPPPTEAEVLAREVRSLVASGTRVYRKAGDSWTERNAGYGDCAILIQSRTRLKAYEAALIAEGIPFRVVGGIGFYDEDEVQAILNVLFFLWNREDRLSLAAALASPLFGLADADLARLLADGGMVEGLRQSRPDIAELLRDWASLAGLAPLAGLVHRIIADTGAYVRFGRRGTQAIFNLDKLLDTAREFDRRGYTTLQDFVAWVKNIRDSDQREAAADVLLPGGGGDVSIMTVHKAKGLEYPVVFLPGMNQPPRSASYGPAVLIDDGGGSGALRMAADGPLYDELWAAEKAERQREQERLLYVAMTRARDHLVMIGTLGDKTPYKASSWLASFRKAIPDGGAKSDPAPPVVRTSLPDGAILPEPAETPAQAPGENLRRGEAIDAERVLANLARIEAGGVPKWKKATDLLEAEPEWKLEQQPAREAGGLAPTVRGNIYHRCLEDLATTGAYDLPAIAGESPEFQGLPKETRERFLADAAMRLKALTENEELAWVFRIHPDAYAELPFLYRHGNEIISGKIDRFVVKDGKGFVIDYKAITIEDDEALQKWIDHYRPQVKVYCEAAKDLFGLSSVEGFLLFVDSGRLAMTVKI